WKTAGRGQSGGTSGRAEIGYAQGGREPGIRGSGPPARRDQAAGGGGTCRGRRPARPTVGGGRGGGGCGQGVGTVHRRARGPARRQGAAKTLGGFGNRIEPQNPGAIAAP